MTQEDIISVFPLPDVVFFPYTQLPLHIFEPRYFQMIRDAHQNHQLIGMFLLKPGWQEDYYGNPPIYSIGCAGELSQVDPLPEQRYNIVLRGLYRARAVEMVQEYPYRKVRVQILPETLTQSAKLIEHLRNSLLADFVKLTTEPVEIDPSINFNQLVNLIASSLDLDANMKMDLLQKDDVFVRARLLQKLLRKRVAMMEWTQKFASLRPSDPTLN